MPRYSGSCQQQARSRGEIRSCRRTRLSASTRSSSRHSLPKLVRSTPPSSAAALACRARAFHNVMALLFFVVIYKNALCLEPHVHG